MAERMTLLIVAKTYPNLSDMHGETVCTGAVREDGTFVRLHPVNYRDKPYSEWYKKYQWITVDAIKHRTDPRPESYEPVGQITPGEIIDTKRNWAERKRYVLAQPLRTMCELNRINDQKKISVTVIKARKVEDLVIRPGPREWDAGTLQQMDQLSLFGPGRKPLERLPYKFSYKYFCEEDGCPGHEQRLLDWEVGQLFRSMRDRYYGDEEQACNAVKAKCFYDICSPEKDVHFFVGTVLRWGTWIVAGIFYPKKVSAGE